ncbi:hypothetical protein QI050_00180 [Staphylococcus saprophyticus]|nr:hypothetical protein [Staphylococcus saprophyticus]
MSYERTTKDSVEYIANKFSENPGHFAATILRMYWDVEKQRDQYKAERDTLIDDIAVLKANISRLEREIKKKGEDADRLGYRWRNSHDEAKTYKSLLSEFSQHVGNKPSSSTYKYFRAKLDGIGIKEGE